MNSAEECIWSGIFVITDKKWKTSQKSQEIFLFTNIEVQGEKTKVWNYLEKEELSTNKNKK